MRGTAPDITNPFPLAGFLPAVLQEDLLLARLTAGLDDVLSPVIATLDCLDAYLDPAMTPPDFLEWLGTWVGLDLPEGMPTTRRRTAIANAVALHRRRATATGLRDLLTALLDVPVTIEDSGGTSWSTTPTDPEDVRPWLRVTAPGADKSLAETIIATAKPAHVPCTLET